jgi:hypothetical protein
MQLKTVNEILRDKIELLQMTPDPDGTPWACMDAEDVLNIITQDRQDTITAVIEMVEGMKKPVNKLDLEVNDITELQKSGYNQALTDIITKLQAVSPKD